MKKYDLVVFGLTFLAAGVASVYKGKTLIVESKTKPGYEFIDSFHSGKNYEIAMLTGAGKEFKSFLGDFGALPEKYIFSMTPYISKWIADKNINVLLMTNILGVKKDNDGYIITLFNSCGITEIFAKQIIDTRTDSYSLKTLNYLAKSEETDRDGKEYLVCEVEVSAEIDYAAARKKVYSAFEGECSHKLVAVADEFYKKSDREESVSPEGYIKRYSSFYDNPLIAFDKGTQFGGVLND